MKKYFVFVILLLAVVVSQTAAQAVQFKVPIIIENGNYKDTLWLGVSGDGPGGAIEDNTYGPDGGLKFGKHGSWAEMMYPPDYPGLKINAKFVDIPGHREIGGTGLKPYDFRGFSGINQVDTFAIRIYGDSAANNPTRLTWPKNLNKYGQKWELQKKVKRQFMTVVEDMTTTSTYFDEAAGMAGQFNYFIIKTGVVPNVKPQSKSK